MKVEIRNWVGVVVLVCLGFILGRASVFSDVNANPQSLEIGRYQLLAGTFTNEFGDAPERLSTIFRIDTVTGKVERWSYLFHLFEGESIKKYGGELWLEQNWYQLENIEVLPDSIKTSRQKDKKR
ncbi:MAG: hypothetical protein GTO24_19500 [candidate division Zixibacteria bacterium]|nr:hypothetical protein [candidate division Zixibacteria bacterium]